MYQPQSHMYMSESPSLKQLPIAAALPSSSRICSSLFINSSSQYRKVKGERMPQSFKATNILEQATRWIQKSKCEQKLQEYSSSSDHIQCMSLLNSALLILDYSSIAVHILSISHLAQLQIKQLC